MIDDHIQHFLELAAVDLLAGSLIEGGEGFQKVHVDIQRFAVAREISGGRQAPVALDIFKIAAKARVGAVFLQKIEHGFGKGKRFLILVGDCVLRESVDGEAFAIDELGRVGYGSVAVEHPIHAAVNRVEEVFFKEGKALIGCGFHFGPVFGPGKGRKVRKAPEHAALRDHVFHAVAVEHAVFIKRGDVSAELLVHRAFQPEGDHLFGKGRLDFLFCAKKCLLHGRCASFLLQNKGAEALCSGSSIHGFMLFVNFTFSKLVSLGKSARNPFLFLKKGVSR